MSAAPLEQVVRIALGNGLFAVVDECDAELVAGHPWRVLRAPRTNYAMFKKDGKVMLLHQLLLPGSGIVDHADGDGLNNRRSNIRPATHAQNMRNSRARGGKSQFKGVFATPRGKWRTCIRHDGETLHLGTYDSEEVAARQYDRAARLLFKEFAKTNEALGLLPSKAAA